MVDTIYARFAERSAYVHTDESRTLVAGVIDRAMPARPSDDDWLTVGRLRVDIPVGLNEQDNTCERS